MSAEPKPIVLKRDRIFRAAGAAAAAVPLRLGHACARRARFSCGRRSRPAEGARSAPPPSDGAEVVRQAARDHQRRQRRAAAHLVAALRATPIWRMRRYPSVFAAHAAHAAAVKRAGVGRRPAAAGHVVRPGADRSRADRCGVPGGGHQLRRGRAKQRARVRAGAHCARPEDLDATAFLRSLTPVTSIAARHTVGMLDPLDGRDPRPDVADGLPVTLQEVIAAYGHSYFKLKVGGRYRRGSRSPCRASPGSSTARRAPTRRRSTATSSTPMRRPLPYSSRAWTRYRRWRGCRAAPLFIEQPIARAVALQKPLGETGAKVADDHR